MSIDERDVDSIIKNSLGIEVDFEKFNFGGSNELTVRLTFNGETISRASCTVEPIEDKGDY